MLNEDITNVGSKFDENFDKNRINFNMARLNNVANNLNNVRKNDALTLKRNFKINLELNEYLKNVKPEKIDEINSLIDSYVETSIDDVKNFLANKQLDVEALLPFKQGTEVIEQNGAKFTVVDGVLTKVENLDNTNSIYLPQVYKIIINFHPVSTPNTSVLSMNFPNLIEITNND
ncbi:UNVERIFIED_CONTAM: hypothetical protein O8I53_08630 [Campylobacter lari]